MLCIDVFWCRNRGVIQLMKIFVVIPAYNEERHIVRVLQQIKKYKIPTIVVDDGSRDETFKKAKRYSSFALRHKTNLGKGAALKTGCDAAFYLLGADAVVMMDSDGQHLHSDLPKFIKEIKSKKYDVIFGSRNLTQGMPFVRFIGNKFASILINILFGIYVSDTICGYRAFSKKGYKNVNWQSSGYGIETEMVILTGKKKLRFCEVSVETVYLDKFKGVTVLDAFSILLSVLKWRVIS